MVPAEQARPPLGRDDIIVEVDGQPVHSLADLRDAHHDGARRKTRASVLVAFDRDLERRLTVVDVGVAPTVDSGAEASKPWIPIAVQVLTPRSRIDSASRAKTGVRVTRVLDETTPLKVGDVILAAR